MKVLKNILILFISFVLSLEFFSYLFIKLRYIESNYPSWVTLYPNKDFGYWHPKNITLKIHSPGCWESKVSYNKIGLRGKDNFKKQRQINKIRIGLLGDSMIENIELSEGYDFASKLRKKLGTKYEVINFSVRGTGLFDQTEILKKIIKDYKVDIILYFVTENDMYDIMPYEGKGLKVTFDIENDKIISYPRSFDFYKYDNKIKFIKKI